jgi:hypothetical protein
LSGEIDKSSVYYEAWKYLDAWCCLLRLSILFPKASEC